MSENGADAAPQPPQMKVLGQYVRDMSFENVMAQKGGSSDGQPDINVRVNLDGKKLAPDGQFEVMVKLGIESKSKETGDIMFMMELEYVAVFQIGGVAEEQLHPFLLIECPRMLFPFIRRIVSDVTRDGGYPPLNLDNIDFLQIYRNEIARRQSEAQPENA